MKAIDTNTSPSRRRAVTGLAIAAGLFLTYAPAAHAGGPALLRLPVDGITEENQAACIALLEEKLKDQLMRTGDHVTIQDGGNVQFQLGVDSPISLNTVRESLAGSDFKIPTHRLILTGTVRLEVGGAEDPQGIADALRPDKSTIIEVKEFDDGTATILIGERSRHTEQRRARPLRALRDVERIVAKHDAKLLDVRWGSEAKKYGQEDHMHWFCRDPYGVERISDLPDVAVDAHGKSNKATATKAKAESKQASTTKAGL